MTMEAPGYKWVFEFDEREHVDAGHAIIRFASNAYWRKLGIVALSILVFLTLLAAAAARASFVNAIWFIAMLGLLLLLPRLNGVMGARQFKKLNPEGRRTLTFVLDDEGVRSASFVGESRLRWQAIHHAVETREFFLFYVTKNIAYYLPKRVITPDELLGVRKTVLGQVAVARVRVFQN